MHEWVVERTGKETSLVTSNENVDDIIRNIKSLKNLGILIDGVSETVKLKIKRQRGVFLGLLLVTLVASMLGNTLTGKGVMRAGKARAGRGYNNTDHIDKKF